MFLKVLRKTSHRDIRFLVRDARFILKLSSWSVYFVERLWYTVELPNRIIDFTVVWSWILLSILVAVRFSCTSLARHRFLRPTAKGFVSFPSMFRIRDFVVCYFTSGLLSNAMCDGWLPLRFSWLCQRIPVNHMITIRWQWCSISELFVKLGSRVARVDCIPSSLPRVPLSCVL